MNTNTICAADFPMEYETADLRNPIVAKGLELWRFRIASSQMPLCANIVKLHLAVHCGKTGTKTFRSSRYESLLRPVSPPFSYDGLKVLLGLLNYLSLFSPWLTQGRYHLNGDKKKFTAYYK